MKKVNSVQNFLNVLTEHNFVNLYYVKNYETNQSESICFLTKNEALAHLQYIIDKKGLVGKFYIAETCVYFGKDY